MSTIWHFPIMIFASFILFYIVILIVIGKHELIKRINSIILLSILCVFVGMLFGKFGANFGLPWWIYYPIPMLINVLMPPVILKLNPKSIGIYLILSFLSAPIVHIFFSLFLDWHEYMPFWKIHSL
ncbi:MAG: hypothetical protein WCJ80_07195 [Bacteroidota bacterium]